LKIGVLAVQGDFAEHIAILRRMGVESSEVRLPHQLQDVDGLIIPGGESTTLSRLMSLYDLREPIAEMVQQGKAVWGTCAGMIMLAREITEEDPIPLGLMDIGVRRNAFGRQIDSFEQDLSVAGLQGGPFHAIFIRAPIITWVAEGVKVLAVVGEDTPVAVQQDRMMATAFHPELTNDTRIHRHFLNLISETVPSPRE
jgi:5'-phosphate synthase pdxT subunit